MPIAFPDFTAEIHFPVADSAEEDGMKIIQFDQFGGPDVLHLAEAPDPHPGHGQVRVRLRAVGVNPFDTKLRAGAMEAMFRTRLPAIPGGEIAGVVDEIGQEVTEIAVGDEVFGWADGGAYAELALASIATKKPKALSWELAASLPVAGETANARARPLEGAARRHGADPRRSRRGR